MKIFGVIKDYFDKQSKLRFAKKTWLSFGNDLVLKVIHEPGYSYYREKLIEAIIAAQYILLEYKDDNKTFNTPLFDDHYFSFRERVKNGEPVVTLYEPTVSEYISVFERINSWKPDRFTGLSVSSYERLSQHDYSIVTHRVVSVGELFYLLEQIRIFVKRVNEEFSGHGIVNETNVKIILETATKVIRGLQTVIR